jgi:restriction system protein
VRDGKLPPEFLFVAGIWCVFTLGFAFGVVYGQGNRKIPFFPLQTKGESILSERLLAEFLTPDFHLLNNVTLPIQGGTTQVDHVLVSQFGVFIIENKHYRGMISADRYSSQWVQQVGKNFYPFKNPLHQNFGHLKEVVRLLNYIDEDFFFPMVVFTGTAIFEGNRPEGVFDIEEALEFIRAKKGKTCINEMYFCWSVGRLEATRLALTKETDALHQENLKRRGKI